MSNQVNTNIKPSLYLGHTKYTPGELDVIQNHQEKSSKNSLTGTSVSALGKWDGRRYPCFIV